MASNDEQAFPSAKKMRIDTTTTIDTVQAMNAEFPKIDNLEYFPEKVLFQIFSMVNDADLLHLSDTSSRFEKFANIAFKDKYTSKYFIFDGDTDAKREMYEELFSRFGRYADIKAIEVNGIRNIDPDNHWLPQLLRQHTNQLRKLTFDDCSFKKLRKFLSEHMNIEHLVLRSVETNADFILPNYRNLKKLELSNVDRYMFENLTRTIRNNPALESLILEHSGEFTFHRMMMMIAENSTSLKHLTELQLLGFDVDDSPIENGAMDSIIDALKNLQSLKIRISNHQEELIQRLGLACKSLKLLHLENGDGDQFSDDVFDALRLLDTIEYFELIPFEYSDHIESLVSHWPNLHQLDLYMEVPDTNTFVLSLLRKCPSIERITFHATPFGIGSKFLLDLQFWNEFTAAMQQPNGKIELKVFENTVGYITKNEIVWGNTLMHWIEYDWSYNTTNVNLLDLDEPSKVVELKQRSPFDRILDYLDLASMYSLSAASKQCKQLVESYVDRHAKQNGTFIIADEFHYGDASGLDMFAEHVEYLALDISDKYLFDNLNTVAERYTMLKKFTISFRSFSLSSFFSFRPHYIFPQVRHVKLNGQISNLCTIASLFPNIETLEIKSIKCAFNCCLENELAFRNLKKFTFKYGDKVGLEDVRKIFENTTTELIPIKNVIE